MTWRRHHEPLLRTLLRTGLIAVIAGLIAAGVQGQPAAWLGWTAFAFWFSFGGHWVEVFYLNWLRPHLAPARWLHITARLLTWLVGGTLLLIGARMTVMAVAAHVMRLPSWWLGGPGFIGVELLTHALPQLRGRPNFFNGDR